MPKGKAAASEKIEGGELPRRGRLRSTRTTAAILASAYQLMASEGLAAASIDAVARHSNVSKMTIYRWWPSREALLIDAFLNQAALMLPLCIGSPGAPADLYDAIYGSLFYRSIFGIKPISLAYARNLVELLLQPGGGK